ncbi:MAG: PAS domain S-box protein [Acidobacteria bacterium]|nr:PAS domain S-box protein [Acidobacteriota bacterium]
MRSSCWAQCTSELEHAWSRCRDLFENMPAMAVTIRLGHDRLPIIEDCNRLFPGTLGYSRDEIIGRPLGDFYAPGSRAEAETQPWTKSREQGGGERQLLDKYGGVLDTTLYLVTTTAPDGSPSGARATYLDITERKREEQRRKESQARYQALVGQTLVGVCIVQDGSIVYANQKMADICGYTLEEQAGFLSFLDLVAEEDRQIMSERLRRYRAPDNQPETHVVRLTRKDGRTIPLEVQGAPVPFGDRAAVAVMALDISERIRLQNHIQQSQRLDTPGDAARVAETFTKALGAILGQCGTLLDVIGRADPRREQVEAILTVASEAIEQSQRLVAGGVPTERAGSDARTAATGPTPSTVLLVEDEEAVRGAVRGWLQQAGYRVLEASAGEEALKLAASHEGPIHVMLTDVKMPGMTGWRLSEELARNREPIPVIYMSGYPEPVQPFDRTDAPAFLQKPFTPSALLKALQVAMAGPADEASSSSSSSSEDRETDEA